MNELIKVTKNQNGEPIVSGRLLHDFLEVKERYTQWFERMIGYGFVENIDFALVSEKKETNNPKNPTTTVTDHALKLNMAKEVAMVQRTEKGKQARLYFIEVESRYLKSLIPKNYPDALRRLADSLETNEKLKEENEILEIALDESLKYWSVRKYNEVHKMGWGLQKCKEVGKHMTGICRGRGIEPKRIPDPLFGEVNGYPMDVWNDYINTKCMK